ncbi:pyrimidine/purine nucleoside phosphorylase|uniref:Pyrimidine/purine nucleoside phosphorylase n=1 Tax=Dendrosporobacter quercicolus TaxID=146817 RepID=A0A1G9UTS7_9FIRM|nr:pyrimidine/purine nucleoside phosphorylase [Dendrosporobacter quercicolus]NSL48040.1 pyrimidine/purine nucleoside phosphorylase [Dendrosporobacter quercicolus DSM 1736]SDM62975.1 hypothetical protein SAMN04488502_10651 [Dendrosporobacter quercicolus]
MSQFENVTVVKSANIYFNGNVTSRTVIFADGRRITLGIMMPGEYEFGTEAAESMEILSGDLTVLLPGATEWRQVSGGDVFNVPAKARFKLKVSAVTDYCCAYITG